MAIFSSTSVWVMKSPRLIFAKNVFVGLSSGAPPGGISVMAGTYYGGRGDRETGNERDDAHSPEGSLVYPFARLGSAAES